MKNWSLKVGHFHAPNDQRPILPICNVVCCWPPRSHDSISPALNSGSPPSVLKTGILQQRRRVRGGHLAPVLCEPCASAGELPRLACFNADREEPQLLILLSYFHHDFRTR